ncbi:nucleotidyltransferase domain-containing protein [Flavihumibacter cheonanensis]|uniref:nucleotidyltransferase family protein n=1 Tax=Flavihumibacter cheonanensis TaxID=1442385 RepID=UPI0034DACF23
MKLLDNYSDSIKQLCATHKVKKLFAFGSVLREDFNESSDIDFLVYFDNMDLINYTNNYFNFKFSLEDLFKRPVDLIEEKALKNPYFVLSISNSRKLVYGNLI